MHLSARRALWVKGPHAWFALPAAPLNTLVYSKQDMEPLYEGKWLFTRKGREVVQKMSAAFLPPAPSRWRDQLHWKAYD